MTDRAPRAARMTVAWRRGVLRDQGPVTPARPLVVKLGGSILGRPGWASEVAALLDSLAVPRLLVTGGGPLVDGLRAIDRAEPQPAELMHRLAIECMGQTGRLVAATLGASLVVEPGGDDPATVLLDVPRWLARAGRLDRLPVGWHVTSDSIAARVAAEHGLPLLLVKSVPPPHDDIDRLAASGWLDEWFPSAAGPLTSIGWSAPA